MDFNRQKLLDEISKAGTKFDGHITNGSLQEIMRVVETALIEVAENSLCFPNHSGLHYDCFRYKYLNSIQGKING